MISKPYRFSTRLFERLFRRSKRIGAHGFTFLVSDARGRPKYAVVVGKKITKSAVKRNRLRRQMYETLRTHLLPKLPGHNVICLYSKKEIMENTREFERALSKLVTTLS